MPIADKIKSIATGDAYEKPAQTKDGAMTTQDSGDAVTTQGTSAEGKVKQGLEAGEQKTGLPQNEQANTAISKEAGKRL